MVPLTADDRHQDSGNIPVDEMILRSQPKLSIPNERNPKVPGLKERSTRKQAISHKKKVI